ncbi:MAG: carboxypeptidase regulatory-like domain-containing protein [Acidobacteriia bacterium]|nr:carboxypeptidase regulatory-like domain-containing protein [Terriglobia bacterium]
MRRVAMTLTVACVTAATLLTATVASAQERGSIVGLVQDSSGAILPGVTVEASSPVLIEQMRTAITDSAGRYAVVDLRPGTYAVTFTLPGFKSFKREGIVIEGAFAAQVNASLAVGAVEETVIVTGASPVVDLQSTQNQTVINREALDVLPAARTMQGGASLVPGVAFYSQGFTSNMSIHGSLREDQHIYFDGMNIGQNLTQNGQQGNGVGVNELAQQELIYDAGSQSAEVAVGGVRMDSIPKEGGNTFSGIFRAFGGTGSLQNDNITDELKPFITAGNSLDYTYDVNTVFGGPIRRNKLWFLVAQRVSQANNLIPLPTQYFPKGGTASSGGQVTPHSTVRLTWQASERNKIVWAFYKSQGGTQRFDVGCTATSFNAVACISPEAAYWLPTPLQYGSQVKWTSPISSRLLLEVGQSLAVPTYKFKYQPENGPLDIQHINSSTSVRTVASSTAPQDYFDQIWNTVVNLSYVTGSHNFKTGLNQQWGYQRTKVERNGDTAALTYVNVNGVPTPSTVTVTNSPFNKFENLNANLGLYAQDKWTLPRLTVTYGARYDYFNASTPDQSAEKGLFMSAAAKAARANIPAVSCLPCWNDWSIRLGASYDLRGDGRTAIKVSVGKFLAQQALGLASSTNPLASQTDSRSWTDLDKNGTIFDANGNVETAEIGVTRNNNFGLPSGATQFDPNLPRPTNWEETVSVQHEVLKNVSVTAGFYHRTFQHLQYTANTLVNPDTDYTPFTIKVPANSSLPGGGGQSITMYNLNANKLGIVNNVLTWSDNNSRVYNGIEASANARLGGRGFVFGGVTTERTATDTCTDLANSNPNNRRFCSQTPPFQALYKASAGYRFPYELSTSLTFQARPGISVGSFYTFNSAIAGVALTGGGNLTVSVVDPTAQYYDYVKTVDTRIARTFKTGRTRIEPFIEIYNLLNFSTILTVNETVGPSYYTPGIIVQGRRTQLGARVDW